MKTFEIKSKKNSILGDTRPIRILSQNENRVKEICQILTNHCYDFEVKEINRDFVVIEKTDQEINKIVRI